MPMLIRGAFDVYDEGRADEWVMKQSSVWQSPDGRFLTVAPRWLIHNLASIPWWARALFPVNGRSRYPATHHDALFATQVAFRSRSVSWDTQNPVDIDFSKAEPVKVTIEMANEWFAQGLREERVSVLRRPLMTAAVDVGGGWYWGKGNANKHFCPVELREKYGENRPALFELPAELKR